MSVTPPKVIQALAVLLFAVLSILSGVTLSNWRNTQDTERAYCLLECEEAMLECCPGDGPFCGGHGDDLAGGACMADQDRCEDSCL